MQIKYLGHASFLIRSKDAKVITDPFDPQMTGIKFPRQEADIVTVSHQHGDHNNIAAVGGDPLIIDWPGEFEKNGVRVTGFKTYHDDKNGEERGINTVYKIEAEGVSVLHCGDLGHDLTDALVDEIGDVDVLLVPVGGFYTISAEQAVGVIKKVEPSIVIPMHYNMSQLDQKSFGQLTGLEEFFSKYGKDLSATEQTDVLTVKHDSLSEETIPVVLKLSQ